MEMNRRTAYQKDVGKECNIWPTFNSENSDEAWRNRCKYGKEVLILCMLRDDSGWYRQTSSSWHMAPQNSASPARSGTLFDPAPDSGTTGRSMICYGE